MKNKDVTLEMISFDKIKDEFIGEVGTVKRTLYEQEELGKLIGVQRAQISKLENNTTNVTIETILRVFSALKAKVNFNVELLNSKVKIAG